MKLLLMALTSLFVLQAQAQTEAPKGFKNATLILADSTVVKGFIKDNMRSSASIVFQAAEGGKKKTYQGGELRSLQADAVNYTCINGDFFREICKGELSFLQKASDASGKPSYNGTEAVFSNGTPGKPSDYFIYDNRTKDLKLVSKKNLTEVATASFAGSDAAITKAKNIEGDIEQLKEAVDTYNSRTK